jgi:protein NrfD
MSLSTVLFLFLAHLGVGIVFTLTLVSRDAGVKFFRFNAGLASVLLVIALAFGYNNTTSLADIGLAPSPFDRLGNGIGAVPVGLRGLDLQLLVLCTVAIVVYWATVGRSLAKIRPGILWFSVVTGTLAIVVEAHALTTMRSLPTQILTVASFSSSAALLGGACTAMILGHWYLVIPSMQVSHLQSIVKVHIASMVVRVVVVAAAVFVAIATWQPGLGPSFRAYILSSRGIFFWQRVLFGLAGPAVLSYLTWETAKIRSTQSATGILYVDFFTVVVGEVLAKYLLLATHVPV